MQLQERFRDKLRIALQAKGWSQSDLARQLEMTPQAVGDYYHGRRCPSLDVVEKFAIALDVDAENLVDKLPIKILQATA